MQLFVDYSLNWLGRMWLKASKDYQSYKIIQTFSFSSYRVEPLDIYVPDFTEGNMWLKFESFSCVSSDKFDIGPINISDLDSYWAGYPYYEFQNGASFAAPVVFEVASFVMSHRPYLLPSDVKNLMNSVQLNSLSNKVKSGGMVRADNRLSLLIHTEKIFCWSYPLTAITSDLKVTINDIHSLRNC